jgi:hypothetical protein
MAAEAAVEWLGGREVARAPRRRDRLSHEDAVPCAHRHERVFAALATTNTTCGTSPPVDRRGRQHERTGR